MNASLLVAAALVATPLHAQGYQATLAQPQTVKLVVKDAMWTCAGTACTAPRAGTSSDGTVCSAVAKKLGALSGFSVGGTSFDSARLARCNGASGG